MNRFTIARISIFESDLEELKKKTGESTNREAINKAINHYIYCPFRDKEIKHSEKKKRKAGRKPPYLDKFTP